MLKKAIHELTRSFPAGVSPIASGQAAAGGGLVPLEYAATGFLRTRAPVLRRMSQGVEAGGEGAVAGGAIALQRLVHAPRQRLELVSQGRLGGPDHGSEPARDGQRRDEG